MSDRSKQILFREMILDLHYGLQMIFSATLQKVLSRRQLWKNGKAAVK